MLKCIMLSKQYVMFVVPKKTDKLNVYFSNRKTDDVEMYQQIKEYARNAQIEVLGENFDANLEKYENDLYLAYEEIDHQTARANYQDARTTYYNAIYDINSGDSRYLYILYNTMIKAKEALEKFESVQDFE